MCACRKGQPLNKEYDIIIGNVADDDVFKTVDMYFRCLWDKEKVLGELRYYKMNNQIGIVNQEILDRLITFKREYEVENNGRLKSNWKKFISKIWKMISSMQFLK